jgi:hypothetical protein
VGSGALTHVLLVGMWPRGTASSASLACKAASRRVSGFSGVMGVRWNPRRLSGELRKKFQEYRPNTNGVTPPAPRCTKRGSDPAVEAMLLYMIGSHERCHPINS